MPDTAEFHRSFVIYTPPSGRFGLYPVKGFIQYAPTQYYKDADERNNSIAAYQLGDDGLKSVRIATKPDQDFSRYATAWERIYSPLAGGDGVDYPVLNKDLEVIGHIGWFSPAYIFIQRGVGAIDYNDDGRIDRWLTINETIEQHGSVRVATTRSTGYHSVAIIDPDPRSDVAYSEGVSGGTTTSIQLLTDKDGTVAFQLGQHSFDGLAPPAIDPYLLIGIGQLVVGIGRGLGSMLIRRIGAKVMPGSAARATISGMGAAGPAAVGGDVGGAVGRVTSRGMGAVGPGAVASDVLAVPRLVGGRLELSIDQMGNRLAPLFKSNPELTQLMKARVLTGDALKREVQETLKAWERRTGGKFEVVADGQVQQLTGVPGNFASMQGGKLLMEKSAAESSATLYEETVHELASSALGGRGVPHIWIESNASWNAQKILEAWVSKTGSFDWFREFLSVAGP